MALAISFPVLALAVALVAPSAVLAGGCDIKVTVTNTDAEATAHVTRLAVKVKGGLWRDIQQHGERILAPGQAYVEHFSPTISTESCDARRRYRVKITCKTSSGTITVFPSTSSKTWQYQPGETTWTTSTSVAIDAACR